MTISIDAKCYYVLVFIMSRMKLVRENRCLKDYGLRLSQAADSIVSYAMALLPAFCFSAAFQFELVSLLGGTKNAIIILFIFLVRIWLGQKLNQRRHQQVHH